MPVTLNTETLQAIADHVWTRTVRTLTSTLAPTAEANAAAVWAHTPRTLTTSPISAAEIATAVWAAVVRTLTSPALPAEDIAHAVWSETVRTLTQGVLPAVAQAPGKIVCLRGDTFNQPVSGLGSLADWDTLYFTVKDTLEDADSESIIQVKKTRSGTGDGLLYLNGQPAEAAEGSITIQDEAEGNILLHLHNEVTIVLLPKISLYDIQITRSTGVRVSTLALGMFEAVRDITRSW